MAVKKTLPDDLLTRGIEEIIVRADLQKKLANGTKLRIYIGIDPTGPHLHIGHATNFLVLKRFQQLGHEIILLIGDFTGRIGDPTDKSAARQPLTEKEIQENLATFKEQLAKLLDFDGPNPARIEFNSRWLATMDFAKVIQLAQQFTVQQMIERDMFKKRLGEGKPISLQEFFYPLMQGYDSVALDADLEVGGSDQLFNMLAGRHLQKVLNNRDKHVLTTRLLVHPRTGKKLMNKSEGGLINLDDTPQDMFGKMMALDDETIIPIAELCTMMPMEDVRALEKELAAGTIHPKDAKIRVAEELVALYHSPKAASTAADEFERVFAKGNLPADMPQCVLHASRLRLDQLLIDLRLAPSRAAAQRLISSGAVKIDQNLKTDWSHELDLVEGMVVQVGKHQFTRICLK